MAWRISSRAEGCSSCVPYFEIRGRWSHLESRLVADSTPCHPVARRISCSPNLGAAPGLVIREAEPEPRPPAVTFVTTEHFVLQGARSSTIAESTGRANMFLAAVSGGLVALGLVATASSVGTAFYAFGLVLLPTLAFVGLVTFERALQSGVEDEGYARRIALLRGYYFDNAPELAPYLLSVPPEDRLRVRVSRSPPGRSFGRSPAWWR
jgi:hypothetical protein